MHTIGHHDEISQQKEDTGFHHLEKVFAERHKQATHKLLDAHDGIAGLLTTPIPLQEIETEAAKMLTAGAITAAMLIGPLTSVDLETVLALEEEDGEHEEELDTSGDLVTEAIDHTVQRRVLSVQLQKVLPSSTQKLSEKQSAEVSRILKSSLGVKAVSELDGYRLNTDYDYTGFEQHLLRYPGDTAAQHDEYQSEGVAPKKGAWGYFANSKAELTPEKIEQEKYYFAVQTFMAPGWNENVYEMKNWFENRKMLMVNTKTGDAVVGVVADAGPALWTGKAFGASPELMHELKLNGGMRNGEVVMMFVDDPENIVPLGRVN